MNKPYLVYQSEYSLQGADLYSGGENDPYKDAAIGAFNYFAFDSSGKSLPFSLQTSILAQSDIDRETEFLEDKSLPIRRFDQKICITVLVWETMDDYYAYEQSDKEFIL